MLPLLLALALGLAVGWLLPRPPPAPAAEAPPEDWVARVGRSWIDADLVRDEMRRRGGDRPGSFQDEASRRALLDAMLYRHALADAARRQGLHDTPELRRAFDQVLADRYLELTLRERQAAIRVSEDELKAYWQRTAHEYAMPARRRVAMVELGVAADAPAEAWDSARARADEALARARELAADVTHFGDVAVAYSDDQASRYRGGVVGWITEGQPGRYRFDPAVVEAAEALDAPGDIAGPIRGERGWYLVRLVEREAARTRDFAELATGLRQRLTRQRLDEIEARFREELLAAADIAVREDRLAAIDPLAPPLDDPTPQPPALPAN